MSNVGKIGSSVPVTSFNVSTQHQALLSRMKVIFGLFVGLGAAYSCYNFYRAYQFYNHSSTGLDDRFKLIKCQILLKEVEQKPAEAESLLRQCESLLNSITNGNDKEKALLALVRSCAKVKPDQAYAVAQRLTSSRGFFAAAECIQKAREDFDREKLAALYTKSYQAHPKKIQNNGDYQHLLKLARTFHTLQKPELVQECMQHVSSHQEKRTVPMKCDVARCFHEMGMVKERDSILDSIPNTEKSDVNIDNIQQHLDFAVVCLYREDFINMENEISRIVQFLQDPNQPLLKMQQISLLASLIPHIPGDKTNYNLETYIKRVMIALEDERIEGLFTIASIYGEEVLNNPGAQLEVLQQIFNEVQSLPERGPNEISTKIEHFIHLCSYQEKIANILPLLENLYDKSPYRSKNPWNQCELGSHIVSLYHQVEQTEQAETFLKKYLADIQKNGRDAFEKINHLTTYTRQLADEYRRAALQAAVTMLPQARSSEVALQICMEEYLQVDSQESLKLLEAYENQQARSHLIAGLALPVFMGIGSYYPVAGTLIPLGFLALQLYNKR